MYVSYCNIIRLYPIHCCYGGIESPDSGGGCQGFTAVALTPPPTSSLTQPPTSPHHHHHHHPSQTKLCFDPPKPGENTHGQPPASEASKCYCSCRCLDSPFPAEVENWASAVELEHSLGTREGRLKVKVSPDTKGMARP